MNSHDEVTFKGLFLPFTNKKALIFIFLIGFVVFFNTLFNGFVGDDDSQIVKNINVHSVSNISQLFTSSTFYNGSSKLIGVYYKPLLTTTFALMNNFFGPNPFIFHLVQILFHLLNASLLYIFAGKFLKKSYSFLITLVFLVHPINGEAVFYASAMQDVLFFFFGIIALNILIKFKSNLSLITVFIFLLLSLFSKETGILFVFSAIVYGLLFDRKRFIKLLLISVVVSAVYIFLRINSIGLLTVATNSSINRFSLPLRLLNIPEMILFYLSNFFWPVDFAITYQWAYSKISLSHFIIPLLIDMVFGAVFLSGGIYLYKKSAEKYLKTYLFFATIFGAGLLFHLQIFPLDQTVADRWFYFPIVGLLGIFGVFLEEMKVFTSKKWFILFFVSIIFILSAKTIIRSFDWRNSLILYKHDVLVSKDSFALESVLGLEYMKRGQLIEAKRHIEKSIELFPYFSNYDNLGEIYVALGDYKKAKQSYIQALKFGDYYVVYEDLAGLSLVSGDPIENMKFIGYALKKFPQDAKLWLYLAIVSYQHEDLNIARHAISQAYLLDKNSSNIPYFYSKIMNNEQLNLKINKLPQ